MSPYEWMRRFSISKSHLSRGEVPSCQVSWTSQISSESQIPWASQVTSESQVSSLTKIPNTKVPNTKVTHSQVPNSIWEGTSNFTYQVTKESDVTNSSEETIFFCWPQWCHCCYLFPWQPAQSPLHSLRGHLGWGHCSHTSFNSIVSLRGACFAAVIEKQCETCSG